MEDLLLLLEYKITDALSHSEDIDRRRCWCDGIMPLEDAHAFQPGQPIQTRAWIDEGRIKGQTRGQFLYTCTLYLGEQCARTAPENWVDCIPPTDTDEWIELDRQKRTLTVYLL